jgi:hypothetical protein
MDPTTLPEEMDPDGGHPRLSRDAYHYFLDITGVMAAPYLRRSYYALQIESLALYFYSFARLCDACYS